MRWIIALALPLLLVLAGVRLLLSYEFLRFEYTRPGFPADAYGFTIADRLEYGMVALDFLFSAESSDSLQRLRLPPKKCWPPAGTGDCPLFVERELEHLNDVKRTLDGSFSSAAIGLFFAAICGLAAYRLPSASNCRPDLARDIQTGLRRGSTLTLAIVLALAVVAATAWDAAFDVFHQLFFPAGSWRFPFSDSLIRLYPEQLFIDAAILIAGFTFAGALIILGLVRVWERRHMMDHGGRERATGQTRR